MTTTISQSPSVTVIMITYNHEKTLAQAVESVFSQRVDFPVNIVIGEDCSKDGTRAVAIEQARKYPDRIKLLLPEKNLGMLPNFEATYLAARGAKYVALLEGDDYWVDETKLARQVELMESRPEVTLCYHNALVVGDHGRAAPFEWVNFKLPESGIRDLACGNYIPTCTALARNGLLERFPDWLFTLGMGEWPFFMLHAERGRVAYIDRIMSHYRVHAGGIWSGDQHLQNAGKINHACEVMNKAFGYRYASSFNVQFFQCWCDLARKLQAAGRAEEARRWRRRARALALSNPFNLFAHRSTVRLNIAKTAVRLFLPGAKL